MPSSVHSANRDMDSPRRNVVIHALPARPWVPWVPWVPMNCSRSRFKRLPGSFGIAAGIGKIKMQGKVNRGECG
jgi:hypothetical protein